MRLKVIFQKDIAFFFYNIDAFFLAPRYTSINKYVDIPDLITVSSFRTQTGLFFLAIKDIKRVEYV